MRLCVLTASYGSERRAKGVGGEWHAVRLDVPLTPSPLAPFGTPVIRCLTDKQKGSMP